MASINLCPKDPLVTTLREVFGANIVRVPEERIQPLSVIASRESRTTFRGALLPLIKGEPSLAVGPNDFVTSRMAAVSGRRSRKVKLDLGLKILEGFLQGFGIFSAEISQRFEGASRVSYSFNNVNRTYVDNNWLGRILTGRVIDKQNPAAAIFFGQDEYAFLIIDSVITSSDFTISVDRTRNQQFSLDVPVIQALVASANVGVQVSTTSGYDVTFQGDRSLSFAFSCVQLYMTAEGRIASMPPIHEELLLGHSMLPTMPTHTLLYSPDRVLLNEEPSLLTWED